MTYSSRALAAIVVYIVVVCLSAPLHAESNEGDEWSTFSKLGGFSRAKFIKDVSEIDVADFRGDRPICKRALTAAVLVRAG